MMQPAPLFTEIAEGPEGGEAYWLTAADGVRLRIGLWRGGETPRGTILMLPGRTEYIEKYGREAHAFTAAGYEFLAVDWRGQGLADRACANPLLGHVGHFREFQLDMDAVLEAAEALDLPRPFYMIGHSMGGCIGLRALHRDLGITAAAFSAPMWGMLMGGIPRPVASALAGGLCALALNKNLAPTQEMNSYTVIAPFEDNLLTRDPEMFAYMKRQLAEVPELTLGGPTNGWLRAALRETGALMASPAPKVPALTFLGDNERIVSPGAIKDLMGRWPGGELVIVKNGEHEVMMELPETREMVAQRIISHFEAHR